MIYADYVFYKTEYCGNLTDISEKDFKRASRHIDVLTYGRTINFNELSEAQKEIVKECTCELVDFEIENDDIINSILENYSLNGVSMSLKTGEMVDVINGICIRKDIYNHLALSGLCCRRLGV